MSDQTVIIPLCLATFFLPFCPVGEPAEPLPPAFCLVCTDSVIIPPDMISPLQD